MPEIKINEPNEKELAFRDEKLETKQPYTKDVPPKNNAKNTKNGNLNRSKSLNLYDPKKLHLIYRHYQQEKQEKVGVPIFTVLFILFCYLICGMLMFSSFEGYNTANLILINKVLILILNLLRMENARCSLFLLCYPNYYR